MPIYVYKCKNCNSYTEELLRYQERENPIYCKKCGDAMVNVCSSFMNDYKPTHSRFAKHIEEHEKEKTLSKQKEGA